MTTKHLIYHLEDPKSLCLFRLSAIGDVTHVVPVVKTLQHRFPDCQITWVVGALEYKLLAGLPGVEFIVFNKSQGWHAIKKLRRELKGRYFDILLLMQLSFRANLLSLLIKAKRRIGFDNQRSKEGHRWFINEQIPYKKDLHVLDGFMQFAHLLGCNEPIMDWHIPVSKQDDLLAKRLFNLQAMKNRDQPHTVLGDMQQSKSDLVSMDANGQFSQGYQKTVIISPCSSHPLRNWSVQRYARLSDYLVERYCARVFLCGSPSLTEKAFIDEIESHCKNGVINIAGQDTLKQLLSMMGMVDLVISPDSGPLHMAGSVGTPVIGLLAASNYQRSGSYQYPHLTVDAYPQACEKFLGKSVSELKWGTKAEFPGSMNLIALDAVINRVDEVLG